MLGTARIGGRFAAPFDPPFGPLVETCCPFQGETSSVPLRHPQGGGGEAQPRAALARVQFTKSMKSSSLLSAWLNRFCRTIGLRLLGLAALLPAAPAPGDKGFKADDLFQPTKVWTLQLTFTADQWAAMEPKGGATGGMAAMFGGGGAPGGAAMFGRGGAGGGAPGGFGLGMFIAPGFLRAADQDGNTKVSRPEFLGLGETWFADWDKSGTGRLSSDQIRAGLDAAQQQAPAAPMGGAMAGGGFLQGSAGSRNGLSAAMGLEFAYVHADLALDGAGFKDVAVRYKGNGTFMESRATLKRSLKVDLNKHVKGQKLAGVTTFNLHNNVSDAGWMNEPLALRLFRDAGVPASRTAYARVYVTVPGKYDRQYLGLYSLLENVDANFANDRFGTKQGAFFKPSTPTLFADLGDKWDAYAQAYDAKDDVTDAQKQRVMEFARLVTKGTDAEFAAKVGDYLDLEEFARFMAVTVYLSSTDSILGIGQNYYMYLDPKTQRFQFFPWDHDHSFGQFPLGGGAPEHLSVARPWQGDIRFLDRVFKVDAFAKLYRARMQEFSGTIFAPARFARQVDELAAAIRPAVQEESAQKLERFNKVVAGEPAPAGGAMGGMMAMQPLKPLRSFVVARTQSIIDQLAGKPIPQPAAANGFNLAAMGGRGGAAGGMGLGTLLAGPFLTALDADKDGALTRAEFTQGFAKWFETWDTGKTGELTEAQLRTGLDQTLVVNLGAMFGRGGAPGRGP